MIKDLITRTYFVSKVMMRSRTVRQNMATFYAAAALKNHLKKQAESLAWGSQCVAECVMYMSFTGYWVGSWKNKTLTSERRNKSGVNPSKKQPTNIATDMNVTVRPPSMIFDLVVDRSDGLHVASRSPRSLVPHLAHLSPRAATPSCEQRTATLPTFYQLNSDLLLI